MFGWLKDAIYNIKLEREGKVDRSTVEYRAIGWNPGYDPNHPDDGNGYIPDRHTDDDPNPSGTDEYYRVKRKG